MSASHNDPPRPSPPSPVVPLAPLDFLQSHRRGSITDPSLHAAPSPADNVTSDPSSLPSDSSAQLRRLLRSPSVDTQPSDSSDKQHRLKGHDDADRGEQHAADRRLNHPFNYNMRRHSIAAGQEVHTSSLPHGTKRKMSADRNGFAPVGEDIDPQLVGPGVPSGMEVDPDAPAPKRRGSAIDSRSLAQLSINERNQTWWPNGRRDFPGTSTLGNYTPGDNRLPGGMATFSWTANAPPIDSPDAPQMVDPSTGLPRPFDPNMPLAMMPPGFPPERRMSGPASLPSVQTRVLRSRSRPPSRQKQNGTNAATTGPSTSQEETASPPPGNKLIKDAATPYSRSPELRISHKLAERKRRKEMKDLFDELRDQLPADRGMKASKWEILSKAIDFVTQLKQNHQDMLREIDMLRHELDAVRQGMPPPFPGGPPPHPVVYGQTPPPVPGQFPPAPPGVLQHPPPPQPHPPTSRPSSSQNAFPPGAGPSGPPAPNGAAERVEASST